MKRFFLLLCVSMFALVASAQPVMRESTHGVLPGYPNPMILSDLTSPGPSGAGVVWDFSAMPQKGPFRGEVVDPSTMSPEMEFMGANTCLVEGKLEAFMKSSRKMLEVLGTRVAGSSYIKVYDTPQIKHKYPFRYGDKVERKVTGREYYDKNRFYNIEEEITIHADGYGTLILPGSTLKNVLRVKWTRKVNYVVNGKIAGTSSTEEYRWYVKSHRYPVVSATFAAGAKYPAKPFICAYNPVVEADELLAEAQKAEQKQNVKDADNAIANVDVRPNPFGENLTVNYTLAKRANVIVSLYNLQGYLVKTLYQGVEEAGAYEKTFASQLSGLPQGAFILRVESAGKALSKKLIKL